VQCATQRFGYFDAPEVAAPQSAHGSSGAIAIAGAAVPRSMEHVANAVLPWAKASSPIMSSATRRLRILAMIEGILPCGQFNVHRDARLNRSAFMTTETELAAIATPAKIGERSSPETG